MSTSKSFDFIWENAIYPTIVSCSINLEKSPVKISGSDIEEYKESFYYVYQTNRETFKNKWHTKKGDGCLSYQKLASVICKSLIEKKFFKLDLSQKNLDLINNFDKNTVINYFFINYKLAFYAGLGVMFISMISDYADDESVCHYLLKKKTPYLLKENSPVNDDCQDYIIKDLAHNDVNNVEFDLISMSVIYRLYKEISLCKYLNIFNKK